MYVKRYYVYQEKKKTDKFMIIENINFHFSETKSLRIRFAFENEGGRFSFQGRGRCRFLPLRNGESLTLGWPRGTGRRSSIGWKVKGCLEGASRLRSSYTHTRASQVGTQPRANQYPAI